MNGVNRYIRKRSISKGAGIAVGGFCLIAFAAIFFLTWLEDGDTIQTAFVVGAFVVGVIMLLIGFLATASAVNFNSKFDLVTLQSALNADRHEYTDHSDHEHAYESVKK